MCGAGYCGVLEILSVSYKYHSGGVLGIPRVSYKYLSDGGAWMWVTVLSYKYDLIV